jgi:hypothetical protein
MILRIMTILHLQHTTYLGTARSAPHLSEGRASSGTLEDQGLAMSVTAASTKLVRSPQDFYTKLLVG